MKTDESLQRELLLVKVPANPITKEIANKFNAVIADEKDGSISLEVVGDKESARDYQNPWLHRSSWAGEAMKTLEFILELIAFPVFMAGIAFFFLTIHLFYNW